MKDLVEKLFYTSLLLTMYEKNNNKQMKTTKIRQQVEVMSLKNAFKCFLFYID